MTNPNCNTISSDESLLNTRPKFSFDVEDDPITVKSLVTAYERQQNFDSTFSDQMFINNANLVCLTSEQDKLPTFFVDMYGRVGEEYDDPFEYDINIVHDISSVETNFESWFSLLILNESVKYTRIDSEIETDVRFLPNCKLLNHGDEPFESLAPKNLYKEKCDVAHVVMIPPFCPTPFSDTHIFGCYYFDDQNNLIGLNAVRLLDLKYYNGNKNQLLTRLSQLCPAIIGMIEM